MALVLTLVPDSGLQGTTNFRVRTIRFGDGYQQDTGDGLNGEEESWPVTKTDVDTVMNPIIAFLKARKGYEAFLWTPPNGVQGLYKCKSYSHTYTHGNNIRLSATFEKSFQP
jgi:phage-related protein